VRIKFCSIIQDLSGYFLLKGWLVFFGPDFTKQKFLMPVEFQRKGKYGHHNDRNPVGVWNEGMEVHRIDFR
jgi:hypothetical protein